MGRSSTWLHFICLRHQQMIAKPSGSWRFCIVWTTRWLIRICRIIKRGNYLTSGWLQRIGAWLQLALIDKGIFITPFWQHNEINLQLVKILEFEVFASLLHWDFWFEVIEGKIFNLATFCILTSLADDNQTKQLPEVFGPQNHPCQWSRIYRITKRKSHLLSGRSWRPGVWLQPVLTDQGGSITLFWRYDLFDI